MECQSMVLYSRYLFIVDKFLIWQNDLLFYECIKIWWITEVLSNFYIKNFINNAKNDKKLFCWVSMVLLKFSHPFTLASGRERETIQKRTHHGVVSESSLDSRSEALNWWLFSWGKSWAESYSRRKWGNQGGR